MPPFFSSHGLLGLNARNLLYVKPFNKKAAIAFADDKLKTKAFLATRGIPTAKIYARIESRDQLREFDFSTLPNECVLKPNFGSGGDGILILKGRTKQGDFLKNGKYPITTNQIFNHIEDTLDGMFSVNGRRDTAFFEEILLPHQCFARFRPAGLPDIRVIVFNMIPVMAMLRIPTIESQGKANVHLGGIGIGIDLAKGVTTHAAQYHSIITTLPHGGSPSGIEIPYWDEILLICSKIQQITNIGYLACDITIDENMGPALLEVNARAGLMVQIANLAPLKTRLEKVKGIQVGSAEKGVRMGKDLFGSTETKDTSAQKISQKPILGTHEVINIACDGANIEAPCIITPDQERTIFSKKLIEHVQEKGGAEIADENEQTYRIKFSLSGEKIQTLVNVGVIPGTDRAQIGRRDLSRFLIDPSREKPQAPRRESVKKDLRAIDSMLSGIDRELLLLKYIKPTNLEEERQRLEQDINYNPIFNYAEPNVDIDDVVKKLEKLRADKSPLGILLEKKRKELLTRISLIRNRGDAHKFTEASRSLYGSPTSALLKSAAAVMQQRVACDLPPPKNKIKNAEEAQKIFDEALNKFGLHDWQSSVRKKIVADCTVGGKNIYIRDDASFSEIEIEALISHEIETHIFCAENGSNQPYSLFRNGCANYLDTQEGLAIYNQNRLYGPYHNKRFNPPSNVLGVAFALDHSFAETRKYLEDELGYPPYKAIASTISMKRGLTDTSEPGGFTKSIVYFRGYRAVLQFIDDGGDLKDLYIGKIAMEDLDNIKKIPELQAPLLLPNFLWKKEEKPKKKSTKNKNTKKQKKNIDSEERKE